MPALEEITYPAELPGFTEPSSEAGPVDGLLGRRLQLIDQKTCLVGPEDRVRERLRSYERAGVDTLLLLPQVAAGPLLVDQVRRIAAAGQEYLTPVT